MITQKTLYMLSAKWEDGYRSFLTYYDLEEISYTCEVCRRNHFLAFMETSVAPKALIGNSVLW